VVTNTGNVTMSNVRIEEGTFTGTGTLDEPVCPAEAASLAPGAQVVCTTVYTVTQDDIDAGEITNSATATGTPPGSNTPIPSDPSTVTVPEPAHPAATVVKTADTQKISRAGQVVTYSFTVTNTGNTSLTDPTINEGAFSGAGSLSKPTCPSDPAVLLPGQKIVCTATYTVVAADLTGKALTNTATVTVTPPGGDPITSDPSTARITDVAAPAPKPLANTGSTIAWGAGVAAVGLLVAGGVLLLIRRRRTAK
jgi:LPXTG-motif cell wall-anchored protein